MFDSHQSQQEISELKISLQRLEGQAKTAIEGLDRKDYDLRLALERKVDAEREMSKALSHVEMLEGRQTYKVRCSMNDYCFFFIYSSIFFILRLTTFY